MAELVEVVDEDARRLAEVEVEDVQALGVLRQADERSRLGAARRVSSRGSSWMTSSRTTPSTIPALVTRRSAAVASASVTSRMS
ncbi:hypothetical protein [Leifsonia sp. P73]|uniref:hypothetical protein n=1 Tax=Leifsonia sp. P73 TaxID=3423959 RepID=UPI003DA585E9